METWDDFYDPDLYDLEVGPGHRVAEAYAHLVGEAPKTCLDIGCGTGDVALRLAGDGHCVTAIDSSGRMLEAARRRVEAARVDVQQRVQLVSSDIRGLDLGRRFDLVVMPNEFVLHLLDVADLTRCLAISRQHLSGGELILDVPKVDLAMLSRAVRPSRPARLAHGVYDLKDGGRSVHVEEEVRFNEQTWLMRRLFRYSFLSSRGLLEHVAYRELVQRAWTPTEVSLAMRVAGFDTIDHAGSRCVSDDRTFLIGRG